MLKCSNYTNKSFKSISNFDKQNFVENCLRKLYLDNFDTFRHRAFKVKGLIPFKNLYHKQKFKDYRALDCIFLPPGFAYLFDYYGENNWIALFNKLYITDFISKYSYSKNVVKSREIMDEIEEDIEYGYITKWKSN